jgi:hypothetical protein
LQIIEVHVSSNPRKPVEVKHMTIVLFYHSKVVGDFAKNANLPRIGAKQLLEKGVNYEMEILCNNCRVSNSMKPP